MSTIRDSLRSSRARWADLADSSQECSRDEFPGVPSAPLVDDSYDTPAVGVENPKDGLNSLFGRSLLKSGPIDFSFLEGAGSPSKTRPAPVAGSPTQLFSGASASASSASAGFSGPMPPPRPMNASAATFVPMAMSAASAAQPTSPDMPPPAVPQAATKSRRIRAKRPRGDSGFSAAQASAPAVKRTREQESHGDGDHASQPAQSSQPQQRVLAFVEPPPATEEDWQHRIHKRVKVVTAIKDAREYKGYIALRPLAERRDGEPRTPTAEDRNLSKRRWEYEIQQWRTQLKQWAADNMPDESGMLLDEVAEEREDELSRDGATAPDASDEL